uniref:Ig-like domain-containing protein n=1 Tax=Scleropages formosus TaxID=113540 RepID=A0A8C9T2M9_SCLFO
MLVVSWLEQEWEQQVVGAPGSDVILPCSFPCSDRENLHDVVVSWQCNGTVVVHSYHDSQDQEHSQSAAYRGRTHLFHDQLLKGNGSLHLKSVQKSDQGWYKCEVKDSFTLFQLSRLLPLCFFPAPYEEPQLSIYVGCGSVNINVTTSRGFPQPVLLWRDETESDITNHSQTRVESDRWGCLEVKFILLLLKLVTLCILDVNKIVSHSHSVEHGHISGVQSLLLQMSN